MWTESDVGGHEQHAVDGDEEGGHSPDRGLVEDLGFPQTQEGLLIAEVDLDLPSVDVGLHEILQGMVRIRGQEIGGLVIEKSCAKAQAVSKRFDADESELPLTRRSSPEDRFDDFDIEGVGLPGSKDGEGLPRSAPWQLACSRQDRLGTLSRPVSWPKGPAGKRWGNRERDPRTPRA